MKKYKRHLPADSINAAWPGGTPGPHNWQKKVQRLVDSGVLPVGDVSVLTIAHDDWCEIYNMMPCNCEPTIINTVTGTLY